MKKNLTYILLIAGLGISLLFNLVNPDNKPEFIYSDTNSKYILDLRNRLYDSVERELFYQYIDYDSTIAAMELKSKQIKRGYLSNTVHDTLTIDGCESVIEDANAVIDFQDSLASVCFEAKDLLETRLTNCQKQVGDLKNYADSCKVNKDLQDELKRFKKVIYKLHWKR